MLSVPDSAGLPVRPIRSRTGFGGGISSPPQHHSSHSPPLPLLSVHLRVQITEDDIERELGLEDDNEPDLELGIGNVKVSPELEGSEQVALVPKASSGESTRRVSNVSNSVIMPLNEGLSDLESVLASGSWYW